MCIFGVRAVFGMGACYVFPQGVLAVVLLMGSTFGVGETRAYTGCWVEQPLCSVVVTALMGAGSAPQSSGVKNPRSGFKLQCEVGRSGVLLLDRNPCVFLPTGCPRGTCSSVMLPTAQRAHKEVCCCCWARPGRTSAEGTLVIGSDASPAPAEPRPL